MLRGTYHVLAMLAVPGAPTSTPSNNRVGLGCAIVLMLALGGCFLMILTAPRSPEHDEISAWVMCEEFVKKSLRSPSSAEFPTYSNPAVSDHGNGRYIVTSHVDSQNAFGAMLRNAFTCEIQWHDGDRWTLENLALGNQ